MTNYFYTDNNGQKRGPVDERQLKELAARGLVTPHTSMETETGFQGMLGMIPGLFAVTPPPAQAMPTVPAQPISPPFAQAYRPDAEKTIRSLNRAFNLIWMPTLFGFGTLLFILAFAVIMYFEMGARFDMSIGKVVQLLCVIPAVISFVGCIYTLVLLYRLWKVIPAHIASTGPGKAVGFLFIPLFQIYWIHIAYGMLGVDMNRALQSRGIPYRVNEGLGTSLCVLTWISLIPGLAILLMPPAAIVMIFFFQSVKDGAAALLRSY